MLKYEQESINFSKFYILCFAFLFEVCLQCSLFSNELCLSLHRHINFLSTTEMTTSGESSFFLLLDNCIPCMFQTHLPLLGQNEPFVKMSPFEQRA